MFGAFPRPGGYTIEAFVVAADLGLATWQPTGMLGFDLEIDVSTPDGSALTGPSSCTTSNHRLGQLVVHATTPTGGCPFGTPECDVDAFCDPTLR